MPIPNDPSTAPAAVSTLAVPPGHPVHALWAVVCLASLLLGFATGRSGAGVAATAQGLAAAESMRTSRQAIKDSVPENLKYDVFLRAISDSVPMGFINWGKDANGNLVLYAQNVTQWHRLTPDQQKAIMGVLAVTYTRFRIEVGLPVDLAHGVQPVLTMAAPDGTALATRAENGSIQLYAPAAAVPPTTP